MTVFTETVAATATGTGAMGRLIFKRLHLSLTGSSGFSSGFSVGFGPSAVGGEGSPAAGIPKLQVGQFLSLAATATGVGRLLKMSILGVVIAALATPVLVLVKLKTVTISAIAVGVAGIGRLIFKAVEVAADGVAGVGAVSAIPTAIVIAAVAVGAVALNRVIFKTIGVISQGIVALSTNYIQFFSPFSGGSGLGGSTKESPAWGLRRRAWRRRL